MWTCEFDGNQFLRLLELAFILIILAMGLMGLCLGLYKLRRAPASVPRRTLSFYRRRWKLDPSEDDSKLRAAIQVFGRLGAWSVIFATIGMLVITLLWLCIAWFIERDLRFIGIFQFSAIVVSILIPAGILACAGRAYGIHRMRSSAKNRLAYGDLQPRRARDYVPAWIGAFFAAWFLTLIILTATGWIFTKVPLQTRLGLDQWIRLPFGRWGLLAIPLLTALFLALGFCLLRWIVAMPRLKALDEISDIGTFDVHFRRESILYILMTYSQSMFFSFGIQWWLLTYNVPLQTVPLIILGVTMLFNGIFAIVTILRLYFDKTIGTIPGAAS
jgi:hypothetical protein